MIKAQKNAKSRASLSLLAMLPLLDTDYNFCTQNLNMKPASEIPGPFYDQDMLRFSSPYL